MGDVLEVDERPTMLEKAVNKELYRLQKLVQETSRSVSDLEAQLDTARRVLAQHTALAAAWGQLAQDQFGRVLATDEILCWAYQVNQ